MFDPETIIDRATYEAPFTPNVGIKCVIVGGKLRVADSKLVGGASGEFITR